MTSTDLTIIDADRERRLAEMLGASRQTQNDSLPTLKINHQDEDDQGREIKKGQFFLTNQDEAVYAPSVRIRPLAQFFQYLHYDQETNKLVNRTIEVTSPYHEMRDMKGTLRCGKPAGKLLRDNPDLAKKYADRTYFRNVYATVSYEGRTADGDIVEINDTPCVMRLKKANLGISNRDNPGGWEDDFFNQVPKGHFIYNYHADLTLKKMKNGSVTYFVIEYVKSPDYIPLDMTTLGYMESILERVKASNDQVEQAYLKALQGEDDVDLAGEVLEYDYDDLNADLQDE